MTKMATTIEEETSYEQPIQSDMGFLPRIKPNAGDARTEENECRGQTDARETQESGSTESGETSREAKQLKPKKSAGNNAHILGEGEKPGRVRKDVWGGFSETVEKDISKY